MLISDQHNNGTYGLETSKANETTERLKSMLSGFSIEITTLEAAKIDDFRRFLAGGTEVYIVSTPSTQPDDVVALAKRLREEDMLPVPHIAARAIPSSSALNRWLENLKIRADISAALIIAGGNHDKPAGPYDSSMNLVRSEILERHGICDLRFAGHPEGHPAIGCAELMNALLEKQSYGERKRLAVALVTQFFFDFAPMAEWDRQLSEWGITLPVRVGLHGIVSLTGLLRQARYCGVGASIETLAKQPARMIGLTAVSMPDRLMTSLAEYTLTAEKTRFSGCHFFSLGNFEKTASWASAIARGNFELGADGTLITHADHD